MSFQGKQKSFNWLWDKLATRTRYRRFFLNGKERPWTAYQYPRTVVEIVFSRIWTVEMSNIRRKEGGPTMSGYRLLWPARTWSPKTFSTIKLSLEGTRPGPRLSTVFTKSRRKPEVPVRHKRKSERKSPSSYRPCYYPWRRGTRGHSSWPSCSTGADLPNVWQLS